MLGDQEKKNQILDQPCRSPALRSFRGKSVRGAGKRLPSARLVKKLVMELPLLELVAIHLRWLRVGGCGIHMSQETCMVAPASTADHEAVVPMIQSLRDSFVQVCACQYSI